MANRFQPRDPYEVVAIEGSGAETLYQPDPSLVRVHRPGFRGRFTHPEYRGELLEINADGFRDEAWPAEAIAGETRILFLGDSTLVGLGVSGDETIPSRVSAALRAQEPNKSSVSTTPESPATARARRRSSFAGSPIA